MASLDNLWPGDEYGPHGNASDVLADGRLLIQGGEVNLGYDHDFSKEGAVYTPDSGIGSWAQLQPPHDSSGTWTCVADAQSVILPDTNKTYMVAGCLDDDGQQALLNPSTMQWSILSMNGKLGSNSEEGYTLLPGVNADVLTIDIGKVSARITTNFLILGEHTWRTIRCRSDYRETFRRPEKLVRRFSYWTGPYSPQAQPREGITASSQLPARRH